MVAREEESWILCSVSEEESSSRDEEWIEYWVKQPKDEEDDEPSSQPHTSGLTKNNTFLSPELYTANYSSWKDFLT